MRLLDLFSGAGGAAMGYHRAGFTEIIGVDIDPQPNYPFEHHQGDAMDVLAEWDLASFDFIHASPPCQHYANVTKWRGTPDNHPDLVEPVRDHLRASGVPWAMENVREAGLLNPVLLCGSMFGLKVRRHRHFEAPWLAFRLVPPCFHGGLMAFEHKQERAYADAMGCDWMSSKEAREAIPPAYTEWIGRAFHEQRAAA